jgi:hypothetical protein
MPAWIRKGLYAVAGLAAFAIAFQVYSIVPAGFAVRPLAPARDTRRLVLLFHGSGGRDEPTLMALEERLRTLPATGSAPLIVLYDWSYADSPLRTFPSGRRVGEYLGMELAKLGSLESLHLIAHSAGAYVVEPLCESYRAASAGQHSGRPARIRMTFLDPIGFRGPLDPGWGARHYGQCADEAEAFINTDDPAPATAEVLRHARTVDVTNDPARQQFARGGHRWPVQYYLDNLAASGSTIEPMPDRDGAD